MQIEGKAWKFGNNIDTDAIIPAQYLNTSDPKELSKHCMENADKEFVEKISGGDIIVAGKNFGCGSSREHAPLAIKACGISCVLANSFARIFYRNSFNIGLPIFESIEASEAISTGDELRINIDAGEIVNITQNEVYKIKPLPPFMQNLIKAGGLMKYVVQKD